ncbi:MAG: XamI family restriction endonuclease [Alphaproteobacteria bacterium]
MATSAKQKRLPKRWAESELRSDADIAKSAFRDERLLEPLDLYNRFFTIFADIFRGLINKLPNVAAEPVDAELIADLVDGRDAQKAFRYLTAPPISEDDLETVADAMLTPSRLRMDAGSAKRIRDTVLTIIDPHRFPWMAQDRQPSSDERERAVIASAALAASSDVGARRRGDSKKAQEKTVKDLLANLGMKEVKAKEIPILTAAPAPGHFCGETRLAGTRADVVARLKDGRVMAIECKVSNSAVNSYKRLVHDTGGKAAHWYNQLGRAQVIPSAVLSGVYNTANLEDVQENKSVYLFWQHRLSDLATFIKKIRK